MREGVSLDQTCGDICNDYFLIIAVSLVVDIEKFSAAAPNTSPTISEGGHV